MFLTLIVFLAVVGAVTAAGMKMYVRPREAMERLVGVGEVTEAAPSHPSLAFHELIKKLGTLIPQSPKDVARHRSRNRPRR